MPILDNNRRELFAQNVARGKPLNEAYVLAGYKENQGNAGIMATHPDVKSRITEIKTIVAARVQVTVERILAELARLSFYKITDAVTIKNGKVYIVDTEGLPDDLVAAISEIRQTRDGVAVKFHDKRAALELLGKHLAMFKDNIQLDINVSLADLVNGSYELERGELKPVAPAIEHDPADERDTDATQGQISQSKQGE
jgi:phage terminase small subunit